MVLELWPLIEFSVKILPFLSLNCIERSEAAISFESKLKNHPQPYRCCLDDNIYHFKEFVIMRIVIKTLFFTIYSIILISSFKYIWYNIKLTCIFKSLIFGVLCANFDHFLSRYRHCIAPGELILRGSYLKPERSRNISRKIFSLAPGDVLSNPDKVFEAFVDIDSHSVIRLYLQVGGGVLKPNQVREINGPTNFSKTWGGGGAWHYRNF